MSTLEIQQTYDAIAAWLRDCIRQSNIVSVKHAESKLRELYQFLAEKFGEV